MLPDLSPNTTMRLTFVSFSKITKTRTIGWITMKSGTNIDAPLRKNCYKFGDPLAFSLVPSPGQNRNLLK